MKITRKELRKMILESSEIANYRPTNFKATHRFFELGIDDPMLAQEYSGYPIRGSLTDPKDLKALASGITESWMGLFGEKLYLRIYENPKEMT